MEGEIRKKKSIFSLTVSQNWLNWKWNLLKPAFWALSLSSCSPLWHNPSLPLSPQSNPLFLSCICDLKIPHTLTISVASNTQTCITSESAHNYFVHVPSGTKLDLSTHLNTWVTVVFLFFPNPPCTVIIGSYLGAGNPVKLCCSATQDFCWAGHSKRIEAKAQEEMQEYS